MKKNQKFKDSRIFRHIMAIIIISIFLSVGVYYAKIKPVIVEPVHLDVDLVEMEKSITVVYGGETVEQLFLVPQTHLKGIELNFHPNDVDEDSVVKASIIDDTTGQTIYQDTIQLRNFGDQKTYKWIFNSNLQVSPDKLYRLNLQIDSNVSESGIAFSLSEGALRPEWNLTVNEISQQTNLGMNLLGERGIFLNVLYWFICLALAIFLVVAYFLIFIKNMKIESFFLVTMFFFGMFYLGVLFSPYSGYDEPAHFDTAYRYSNVLMGKGYATESGGYLKRIEDSTLGLTPAKTGINNIEFVAKNIFKLSRNSELVETQGRSVNPRTYLYLPSAVGITIARLLNLGQIPLFLMARFFNLLTFVMLVYLGIKKMPFGKTILFCVAMLPLLLEQVSSVTYDVMIVGMAFFFVAQCLSMAFEKKELTKRDYVILFISGILLAPSKVVYILICLCVFLIPQKKFTSKKKYILFLIAFFLAIGLSYLFFSLSSILEQASSTDQLAAFAQKPAYKFSFIYEHPLKFCKLLFNTGIVMLDSFFLMPFKVLYLVELPVFLGIGYMVLLVLASLKTIEEPLYLTYQNKKVFFAILVLLILLLYVVGIVMTVEGSVLIQGVQGRYLLPAIPIIALFFRNKLVVLQKNIDQQVLFGGCVLETITVVLIFISIIEG